MRRKYIIIAAICLTLLVVIPVIVLLFSAGSALLPHQVLPTPTPFEASIQSTATPTIIENKQLEKAVGLTENKQPLSQTDQQVKTHIIALQDPNVDAVYSTDEFVITYIRVFDEFQVEIDSTD